MYDPLKHIIPPEFRAAIKECNQHGLSIEDYVQWDMHLQARKDYVWNALCRGCTVSMTHDEIHIQEPPTAGGEDDESS